MRLKLINSVICEKCGKARFFGQVCDCDAPQYTPPARGQLPTTEHYGYNKLIDESDTARANRGYGK